MTTKFDSAGDTPAVESILSIENVADTFGISRWLLRYCEFRGLIRRRRRVGGGPVYSWSDCDRIAFIIKCRRAGINLSEIASIARASDAESARVHESAQELCAGVIERLEQRRKVIDEALSELTHLRAQMCAKCGSELSGDAF